jgi:DNA-binding SARP family transcriptional activator
MPLVSSASPLFAPAAGFDRPAVPVLRLESSVVPPLPPSSGRGGSDPIRARLQSAHAHILAGNVLAALLLLEQALGLRPRAATADGIAGPNPELDFNPRVVVRTLGLFELIVDGAPLGFGKKPARRTLALLKAIIAFGGRDVCRSAVGDVLWPDLDGDRAQNALEVTLHRLRERLRVPGAVLSQQGRLSLSPDLVWVDAFAFDAASRAVNPGAGCGPIERAFVLYRGAFLPEENGSAWASRMRERLRARFVSIVAGAAAALEARDRLDEAIGLYERGIAADEMVPAFHDGLVRCLNRLGRSAEAQAQARRLKALEYEGTL